jgi:hypothetical protein
MKVETNFFEILLRQTMIGMTIYNDAGTAIVIDDINYDPLTEQVFIKNISSGLVYKMSLLKNFDFDYTQVSKLIPNTDKIRGKRNR